MIQEALVKYLDLEEKAQEIASEGGFVLRPEECLAAFDDARVAMYELYQILGREVPYQLEEDAIKIMDERDG